jgi:myosin heavy subunit
VVLIRGAFLRYLSRKYMRRRKFELELRKRHRSAAIIQARIRGGYARTRVLALIEKRRMIQCFLAAVKIQSALRRMYARRRVHQRRFRLRWIAARMIQSWYRAKYSRRIAAQIRKKDITPLEAVDAAIARAETVNPKINAIVTPMFERARAQAKAMTAPWRSRRPPMWAA